MTKALLEMPVAVVLPHMRGGSHQCHAKRETGPCPHPQCRRGHVIDTYFVAEPADPLPLNIDELETMSPCDEKRVAFRRREWRHGRWPGLAVFAWRQSDTLGPGLPLELIKFLPGQYVVGSWLATDAEEKAFDAGVVEERARTVAGLRRDAELLAKPDMSAGMEMVVATILDNADKIERKGFSDMSGEAAFGEALVKAVLEQND